jgi:glyoxylase I family protein
MIFHHIALNCKDQRAVEQFYVKHFGFRRARVVSLGAEEIIFIKSGAVYLELFQAKGSGPTTAAGATGPEYAGCRHLAFKVDDVAAKIAGMGQDARVTAGPMDFGQFIPGWRTAWVSDPEGNIVEISQGFVDDERY